MWRPLVGLMTDVGASTQQLTQRGHRPEVPVLESDRGHARRVRARLLIQLPGQVLTLLLSHLDAQAAGLALEPYEKGLLLM